MGKRSAAMGPHELEQLRASDFLQHTHLYNAALRMVGAAPNSATLEGEVDDLNNQFARRHALEPLDLPGVRMLCTLARDALGIPDPEPDAYNPEVDPWGYARTLADAYAPREPIEYIVGGIWPLPSVSMVMGRSGALKSMVLMDVAACLVGGSPWLPPLPNGTARTFDVKQCPVLWLNFDNPSPVLDERFEAFGRAHGLPPDACLHYFSFPDPHLIATKKPAMDALVRRVQHYKARFVVVDCLQTIKGDIDENSADMGTVIVPFRKLSETCNCAVVLIHHVNKEGGFRGSTAIENLIDFSLLVEREGRSKDITVRPQKVRHADILPFGAVFAFDHKVGSTELEGAKFYGVEAAPEDDEAGEVDAAVLLFVQENPRCNRTAIKAEIMSLFEGFGVNRVSRVVVRLTAKGLLSESHGPRNAKVYTLSQ